MNRAWHASLVSIAALSFLTGWSPPVATAPAPMSGAIAGAVRSVKVYLDGALLDGVVDLPELGASATQITVSSGGGGTTTSNSSVRVVPVTLTRYLSSDAKLEQWANAAMNNMAGGAPGGTPSVARKNLKVIVSSITSPIVTYLLFACLPSGYVVTDILKDSGPNAMEHLTVACQRLTTQR